MSADTTAGAPERRDSSIPGVSDDEFERNRSVYTDVVAKYYGNPEFRRRLERDPTQVLKAEGLALPEGAEVKILFNSEKVMHLVLPGVAIRRRGAG